LPKQSCGSDEYFFYILQQFSFTFLNINDFKFEKMVNGVLYGRPHKSGWIKKSDSSEGLKIKIYGDF